MARKFKIDITLEDDLDHLKGWKFKVYDWEAFAEIVMQNKHYNTPVKIDNITVKGKSKEIISLRNTTKE